MRHFQDTQKQVRTHRWNVFIVLAVFCCLGLTAVAASFVRDWEAANWQNRFVEMARLQKTSLQSLLEQRLELVEYLTVLYQVAEQKSAPRDYINALLGRYPEIDYIGWSVEVQGDERDAFVAQMRSRGRPDFDIQERDAAGEFSSAVARDRYYPLIQVIPSPALPA